MRALILSPDLSSGVIPDPVPSPSQVLIQVSAVPLDYGEIAYRPARPSIPPVTHRTGSCSVDH
ncbi:hypothetical protein [Streptosporangium sp. NPDC003464]